MSRRVREREWAGRGAERVQVRVRVRVGGWVVRVARARVGWEGSGSER